MKPRPFISAAAVHTFIHGSISFCTKQITSINQAVAEGGLSSPAGHEDKWMLAGVAICISLLLELYGPARSLKAAQQPLKIWSVWTSGGPPRPLSLDYPSRTDILSSVLHLLYLFAGVKCSSCSPVWIHIQGHCILVTINYLSMTTEVFASRPPYSVTRNQPVQKPCLMRPWCRAERLYLPGRDGPAGDCLGSISQDILKCLIIPNHKRLVLINGLWRYTSQFRRLTTPRSHSESFMFYVPTTLQNSRSWTDPLLWHTGAMIPAFNPFHFCVILSDVHCSTRSSSIHSQFTPFQTPCGFCSTASTHVRSPRSLPSVYIIGESVVFS